MTHSEDRLKKYRELPVFVLTIIAAIIIPFRAVFYTPAGTGILLLEGVWSFVFIADAVINFRNRTFLGRNEISKSGGSSGRWYVLNVLAALPFDFFFDLMGNLGMSEALSSFAGIIYVLRFLRLLYLLPALRLTHKWQQTSMFNASFIKMVFLFFWIMLIAHWAACGWIFLGKTDPLQDISTNYIRAIYWAITTLATIGYGDIVPVTNTQTVYAMFVEILGAGMYGYIIGNIANLLANMNIAKTQHLEKMEKINTFMRYKNLSPELQQRIRQYYDYLWESRRDYDEALILKGLPSSLMHEVSLFLKKEIIEKVPMFKGASNAFIKEIVTHLKPEVYMPGDYIFHFGDVGHNMYFISRGVVEIISADASTVYATLTDGDFFGEVALLTNQPRTAGVRAVDYCDLYSLDKKTFENVLEDFPAIAGHIHAMAKERLSSINAIKKNGGT